ncbi:MAG TPA: histidine phosphatase family protein [Myxococcota bacterium]|nr:histidine phosphatase family protein [Myxococcota bacterium]
MELYLVRHGAVDPGQAERRADPPLSAQGRAQAEALAARLAAVTFDRCLVSPLARAQETARVLCAGRALAPETHACLAEGSYGALDGLEPVEARRRHPEFFRKGRTVLARLAATGRTAPGGETRAELIARAARAHELLQGPLFHPSARSLVVSHGGLLAFLVALLVGHEPREEATYGFEHCAFARVVAYREEPAYGPFAMLYFAAPPL